MFLMQILKFNSIFPRDFSNSITMTYIASLNAQLFVRTNGIRDASGLSTSELGRFTRLERDRATSGSNRLYSLFGLTLAPRYDPIGPIGSNYLTLKMSILTDANDLKTRALYLHEIKTTLASLFKILSSII